MAGSNPVPPGYDPQKDRIEIVPYDSQWPKLFTFEKRAIQYALGYFPGLRIEHFGSTAVPGLAAKPILDILVGVSSKGDWPKMVQPLAVLGYVHGPGAFDDAIHWFFVKGMPPFGKKRMHQIHFYELEGEGWRREVAFRDHLRTHTVDAMRYEFLKRELASKFASDREAYTEAKGEFIREILRKL